MAVRNSKAPLLSMSNISKSFGEVDVLSDVNFEVGRNEIIGLVGDNGAGKSTLIKIITGVHPPSTGEIFYKGEKITRHSVKRSRELGIETVYQERALADQQALWRNVFAGRELTYRFGFLRVHQQKAETTQLIREHMGFTSKAIHSDSMVLSLSGGEKQGVAIGRALYFEADLIILDEPTEGLAPIIVNQLSTTIRRLKSEGISILMAEQNLNFTRTNCDRAYILYQGRIQYQSLITELSQEAYERYCAL